MWSVLPPPCNDDVLQTYTGPAITPHICKHVPFTTVSTTCLAHTHTTTAHCNKMGWSQKYQFFACKLIWRDPAWMSSFAFLNKIFKKSPMLKWYNPVQFFTVHATFNLSYCKQFLQKIKTTNMNQVKPKMERKEK